MKRKKGGPRPGAGRKKLDNPKVSINLFVEIATVNSFGGKDELRKALYAFIEGGGIPGSPKVEQPVVVDMPSNELIMEVIHKKARQSKKNQKDPAPGWTAEVIPTTEIYDEAQRQFVKFEGVAIPPVAIVPPPSVNRDAILKQIEAIRSEVIPKERDTPIGRKSWSIDQAKRIKELENQLL